MTRRNEEISSNKNLRYKIQRNLHFYLMLFVGANVIIWSCSIITEDRGGLFYLGLGVLWISLSPYFLFQEGKQNFSVARTIGLALAYLLVTIMCAIDMIWEIRILVIAIESLVLIVSFLVELWIDKPMNKNN